MKLTEIFEASTNNSAKSFIKHVDDQAKILFPEMYLNLSDLSFTNDKSNVVAIIKIIFLKRNETSAPGEGKKLMNWLCKEADKNNVTLTLTVLGGDKLVEYYKQFG